ncbi:MAG TPA: protein kinase [Phycisphaerales bacterium]|nr:protein kinase [Phycisphaerales bacterium]
MSPDRVPPPHATPVASSAAPGTVPADLIGDVIGAYKLLDKIGEGGFGSVWLAERRGEIVQRVALKLIRPGMDSRAIVARFEQERQALAMMDHPSVARVYDAGTTNAGRPYFAMEYVAGLPIDEYCTARGTPLAVRLELFAQACEGVHHAHERGIIHRDIKPGNILVSEHDGRPQAKVIDFGIAKALAGPLTDKTLVTREGNALGTPFYMSPEQHAGEVSRLGPASDVFALGVTMFEVLSGRLPWECDADAPPEQVRRRMLVKPPASLRSLVRGAQGAAARDLETVFLRATDGDPGRRYASARELAEDVRRVVRSEPVIAQRNSPWYVVQRRAAHFASANRAAAALLAWMVGAVLGAGLVTALWRWTPAVNAVDRVYQRAELPIAQLERVRVLALDGETPTQLATAIGMEPPGSDDTAAMRRVHGKLLERMASMQPACVLMDISFNGVSEPHDGPLADGVRAMQAAGTPVVFASRHWWFGDSTPPLSPAITSSPWPVFGGITTSNGVELIDLAVSRDGSEWLPHVALAAVGAVRHPGAEVTVVPDPGGLALVVSYWERVAGPRGGRRSLGPPDRIPIDVIGKKPADVTGYSLLAGDRVALLPVGVPSDAVLSSATRTVTAFIGAPRADQQGFVRGRVVVIGNPPKDTVTLPDGRNIAGPHVVASAVEQLLRGVSAGQPSRVVQAVILVFSSLVGVIIVAACGGWRRVMWALAAAMLSTVVGVLLYAVAGVQASPLLAWCGIAGGCFAGALLVPRRRIEGGLQ